MKIKFQSKITLSLTMLVMTLIMSNLRWGGDHWRGIIEADGKGYYAYLPAVFIYHDLNFGFFDPIEKEKYYDPNGYYDYRANGGNGEYINKYYSGTAVAELPFFLGAHLLTRITGGDADGYSKYYLMSVSIAALFYLFIGLFFLRKIFLAYKIPDWVISITLAATVFGTNLFCYTVVETGMSHVFSFAFISMFLYFGKRYFDDFKMRNILLMALCLGMIALIRPLNLLIVFFLPFIASSLKVFTEGIKKIFQLPKIWIPAILIVAAIGSIQLLIYKISTGSIFVYSYQDETFHWLDPHFIDILFSYRKGLFLYTPMYLLGAFGCFSLWKKNKYTVFCWLGFSILITYIFSSWWMWYYGGGFSGRTYVEYLPVFMIPLAILLKSLRGKFQKIGVVAVIICLIAVCQIQTYQYRYYEIHWDQMTKEKYWDVFLMRNR